jgi:hypothetical protein
MWGRGATDAASSSNLRDVSLRVIAIAMIFHLISYSRII